MSEEIENNITQEFLERLKEEEENRGNVMVFGFKEKLSYKSKWKKISRPVEFHFADLPDIG